jgi:hypothetical protein
VQIILIHRKQNMVTDFTTGTRRRSRSACSKAVAHAHFLLRIREERPGSLKSGKQQCRFFRALTKRAVDVLAVSMRIIHSNPVEVTACKTEPCNVTMSSISVQHRRRKEKKGNPGCHRYDSTVGTVISRAD